MYSESRPKRKRLPQLLDDPTARRMLRDVEMQDTPAIVADDKETVEDAERDRGHGEEVHRRNRFPVILKKRAPTFGWPGIPRRPLHPPGDGSLGDVKAQHEKLAVNARSTPDWVLRHHAEDQLPNFLRQSFPTDLFSQLRDQTPVQSKPSSMPADHGFGSDHQERLFPVRPEPAREHPEELVKRQECWPSLPCASVQQVADEAPNSPEVAFAVNESNGPTVLHTAARS